jgi:putative membrane protein
MWNQTNRLVLFMTFGVYCFLYPSSFFLLVTDQVPAGTEWMATLMLVIQGVVATAWTIANYGALRGFLAALAVLTLAFTIEAIGASTGFPFGHYSYTEVLYPKLFIVPVGIMFAWLMMILASFFMAQFILDRIMSGYSASAVIFLSASLAVLSDLLMEPVAVHVQGYWVWYGAKGYYGVPLSNFIAWLATSLMLVLVLNKIMGHRKLMGGSGRRRFNFIPLALYMMNLTMFTSVNLTHAYYLAGCIGVIMAGLFALILLRGDQIKLSLPKWRNLLPPPGRA